MSLKHSSNLGQMFDRLFYSLGATTKPQLTEMQGGKDWSKQPEKAQKSKGVMHRSIEQFCEWVFRLQPCMDWIALE